MGYKDYLAKRFLSLIGTLMGLLVLIFVIARVIPGDPVRFALGPLATQEQIEALSHQMGLDQPLLNQFFIFLQGLIFRGDFGISLQTYEPVRDELLRYFPASFELITASLVISIAIAVPLGVVAALHKDRWIDQVARVIAVIGLSPPAFWIAILFQLVFAYYFVGLPIFGRLDPGMTPPPTVTSFIIVDSLLAFDLARFTSAIQHIILPALSISFVPIAMITRHVRSAMIEQSGRDYILLERAMGLSRRLIAYKYMLKNAFTPALTIIGLCYGFSLGTALPIEVVFGWPGIGWYGVNAFLQKDFNAIVGVVMLVGLWFCSINFIVDILQAWLDPRIRLEKGLSE